MDIIENGQGFPRQNLHGDMAYASFCPAPLASVAPLSLDDSAARLLAKCSLKLGELQGSLSFVPNAPQYLAMYVRKEALVSSQIEGTQCTFDDILDPRLANRSADVTDVVAYVRALNHATQRLSELPLCIRLLRETHRELLQGTRGAERNPGLVRTSQNWIGTGGCSLSQAAFVPPNIEDMTSALIDLEAFMNDDRETDPLIKAALIHYQFETIHPFLDGNGRLGRLLITLSLMNDGVLSQPLLYPSYQLKLRRSEYYDQLMNVRRTGSYASWVSFFCACMLAAAEDGLESIHSLASLHEESLRKINVGLGRTALNGHAMLSLLEECPLLDVTFATERLGLSRTTVANLMKSFVEMGILQTLNEGRSRYRIYGYEPYLKILRRGASPL
ncbi:Fic family protein [Eggerthellaceae bacterium zg-1084]|uniref:Fic family protein n=1 Tax=Berryella wangjianweii TaxID=2734634 RepID=UPI0015571199|nr:Fic family protein [Berryella wangjianweii]NPD30997.1 Fic family protein [Berryella wangjianweii]